LSLSSTPNVSTQSLPGSLRQKNGFALKPDSSKLPEVGIRDPLEVLRNITGNRSKEPRSRSDAVARIEKPQALAEDINFGELSLEQFVDERDTETAVKTTHQPVPPVEQCELTLP
jgi:hypothetical protein